MLEGILIVCGEVIIIILINKIVFIESKNIPGAYIGFWQHCFCRIFKLKDFFGVIIGQGDNVPKIFGIDRIRVAEE